MGKGKVKPKENSNEPVTKGMLDDAVDTILNGMDNMFSKFQGEVHDLRIEMKQGFRKVDNRLKRVEVELGGVKDEIKDLKAGFSNTPSRREFNTLKQKVDRFHPNS